MAARPVATAARQRHRYWPDAPALLLAGVAGFDSSFALASSFGAASLFTASPPALSPPPALSFSAGLSLPSPPDLDDLPPRKSVTYQPLPFSWNPAALMSLLIAGSPQAGQSFRGASDSFCRTSFLCPQLAHWYS